MPQSTCLGCQLANKEIEANIIYENDWITCILDIAPLNEGILTKKHFHDVDDLDDIRDQIDLRTYV